MRITNLARELWFRAFCLLCLLPLGLEAQQKSDTITNKVHQLQDVTVKARRTPQRMAVASPLQTINRKEIEGLGLQNMGDAVRRFTGASVKDYGGIGGLKTISVRSLGAEHTAVAYDGVAVSNCQAGQIDIGRFSLDDVDLLSLSIGQDNNLMQSARLFASAGVLSVYSRNPLDGTQKSHLLKAQLKTGSFGFLNPSLKWVQRIAPRTTYSISGNFLRADGGYPFTLINGKYTTKEKRKNSDIQSWHTEANLYYTLKDSSRVDMKAYYYDSERGLPGSVVLYNDQANERLWDKNFFVQTRYKKYFSQQWALQLQAKYNYSWNKYEDTDVKYEGGKQTDRNKQQEYYVSATALYQPFAGFSASLATDVAVNTLDNNLPDSPSPVRFTSLSALNIRYRWKGLTATATAVNTWVTEHVKQGEKPADRRRLSPAFSLMYRPFAEQSLYLRLMYKDTFRVPTFNDLYYLRMGNTGLRPEKAREYNVGITWNGAPFSFTDYVMVTVDGYYNKVNDKIVAFPSTYVWKMMNFGKVDVTGIDVTLRTGMSVSDRLQLLFTAGYTYQKAIDVTDPTAKNYKEQIPYSPKHSGNIGLLAENDWVNLGYSLTGVGKRYSLPQNLVENQIDGYLEHTLSASRSFLLKSCKLTVQAELVNLTNEQYDIIKYYPMPGRSFRVTGRIEF
ncbi:MAG: TonB-dependent receptor [Bacteroides sp.]|nr:TonB-dependent receptor [Bacteroides sp.]